MQQGKSEADKKPLKDTDKEEEEQEGPELPKKPEKKPRKALQKSKKKIPHRTKKRAKQERKYTPVRRKFLKDHPVCEIPVEGCTHESTELHHAGGREGDGLLREEDFKAACHNCHTKATEHSRRAINDGRSKTRLGKPNRKP